jgi:signal transduction histidine kinase/AmiR/NasT family two-component response regulator
VAVAQTNRYETNHALAEQLQEVILDWTSLHDPEDLLLIPNPLRIGTICITTRSLGHQAERGVLAAAFIEPSGPTPMQHLLLNVAATQAATAVHNAHLLGALRESQGHLRESESRLWKWASQLQTLAKAARLITSNLSLRDLLDSLTSAAREVIPAHQAVTSLTVNDNSAQAVQAVSLSEEYASWRQYDAVPDGSGIYSSVCRENRPFRLTQAELEAHPAWRGFGREAHRHPQLRGWLAVPLVDADGTNMGLVQMSDKYEGDFTEDDEALLVQLAQIASVAITNARLYETVRTSEERLRLFTHELELLVHDRTKELVQSQERLRALASELNLTEQRERKRLATELHDHLQQMLVFCKLTIGQGKRSASGVPACESVMNKVDNILSDALIYSRTLVAELSPPVLRDHGLSASLKWLAEYMKTKHEQTVTVVVPDDQGFNLPEEQRVLLFQSVRELLINSAKHAGTGQARLTMVQDKEYICITVRDDGQGFDLAVADSGTVSDGISSKFGLFSIQERMRALGGSFEIQSAPGKGTSAILTLPLAEIMVDQGAIIVDSPFLSHRVQGDTVPTNRSTIRILIADDHAMIRQGLRTMLEAYKDVHIAGEATNGAEAITLAQQIQPDVVLMDINMPQMNGIDATAGIKRHFPHIVIVGLSVNADRRNREAMIKAGAATLLTKEAPVEELYQAIQQALTAFPLRNTPRADVQVYK